MAKLAQTQPPKPNRQTQPPQTQTTVLDCIRQIVSDFPCGARTKPIVSRNPRPRTMDHEYTQPAVLMFDKLPVELICRLIVMLNGGAIGNDTRPEYGYLYPGYRGGRELYYFKISRDAMTFWKHVCKYLRLTYSMNDHTYNMLFSDYHSREHYIPRHLYAGNPKPWIMRLCFGPQTHEEALAIEAAEAAEEAKIAAK